MCTPLPSRKMTQQGKGGQFSTSDSLKDRVFPDKSLTKICMMCCGFLGQIGLVERSG